MEIPKRPKRNPLSAGEVADIVALRQKREHIRRIRYKKTRSYKLMNIFNMACFFVYLEIIFCFFGPCIYERQYYSDLVPNYRSDPFDYSRTVSDIDVVATTGFTYNFVVNADISLPPKEGAFLLGRDFLLRKKLKGVFENSDNSYRLFAASPVLILSALVIAISCLAYMNNLNEHAYPLTGLAALNIITMTGILLL